MVATPRGIMLIGKGVTLSYSSTIYVINVDCNITMDDKMTFLTPHYPLWNLGFRPFFAAASLYGSVAMLVWFAIYTFGVSVPLGKLPLFYWHGHEMVFGYAMAAVAGFLLTAVGNWTGIQMPHGKDLMLIWFPWLIARLIFLIAPKWFVIGIFADFAFLIILFIAISRPIIAVKQWRQMGILSKIVLMMVANFFFLLAARGWIVGYHYGLYLGVFSIIGLLLTIGRRVTPFFISRGVGYPFEPKNSERLDRLCLIGFLGFFFAQLFLPWQWLASVLALFTAICHALRLQGWYTKGIWKVPLLWSMFIAMGFVIVGLFLYFLRWFMPTITESIAIHAMAVGGIGIMVLSMMARVSLGHTGRNIYAHPQVVTYALGLVSAAAFFRVVPPLVLPDFYLAWIGIAQIAWALAFFLLAVRYMPFWTTPRVDGKSG